MLADFKSDLCSLGNNELVHKYYLSGPSFALDDNLHYRLRQEVADYFAVEYNSVFMVGSAKLGFSIKPSRRFMPFYDSSDVDLVIISESLFKNIWLELYLFEKNGGFWPMMSDFKKYHFQGWIRPDKLPLEYSFEFTKKWWNFFEELSGNGEYGPYKVRGGLYYSMDFFRLYQEKCLEQCRNEVSI